MFKRSPLGSVRDARKHGRTITQGMLSTTARSPLAEMPIEERDRIAGAVHRCVDSLFPGQAGTCHYHAMAGTAILTYLGHDRVHRQYGSLVLRPDPDDPELGLLIDADQSDLGRTGEFHAWVASEDGMLFDFAARHWPGLTDGTTLAIQGATTMPWKRPTTSYLWSPWDEIPEYVSYRVHPEVTTAMIRRDKEWMPVIVRAAVEIYRGGSAYAGAV
jgi:hypothetical protein